MEKPSSGRKSHIRGIAAPGDCVGPQKGVSEGQDQETGIEHMLTDTTLLAVPLGYLALQILALTQMRAGWHRAAILPAVLMAVALVVFVGGMVMNASLATAALMLGLPVATLYLCLLLPAYWLLGASR
jgi:hypothetical protein